MSWLNYKIEGVKLSLRKGEVKDARNFNFIFIYDKSICGNNF